MWDVYKTIPKRIRNTSRLSRTTLALPCCGWMDGWRRRANGLSGEVSESLQNVSRPPTVATVVQHVARKVRLGRADGAPYAAQVMRRLAGDAQALSEQAGM